VEQNPKKLKLNKSKGAERMNRILEVCLVAVTLAANFTPASHAQSPAMQQGISVQMPQTNSAVPMPEADNEDAWIVTVTADGSMYFGTDPVTAASLADEMKRRPRNREQKLYVKADARTAFAHVERALEAGRSVFFETAVMLTSQAESPVPGTIVSPKGLEVLVGRALPAGTVTTVVQLLNSGRQRPALTINGDEISWSALESTLRRHFQKGDEKVVLLKADARLPFADVVQAVDACRAIGAKVVLGHQ
jgi:biopolymer transport protein ExbD